MNFHLKNCKKTTDFRQKSKNSNRVIKTSRQQNEENINQSSRNKSKSFISTTYTNESNGVIIGEERFKKKKEPEFPKKINEEQDAKMKRKSLLSIYYITIIYMYVKTIIKSDKSVGKNQSNNKLIEKSSIANEQKIKELSNRNKIQQEIEEVRVIMKYFLIMH